MIRRERREQTERDRSILARGDADALRERMGGLGNREAWRGYLLRHPALRLIEIRRQAGMTQRQAAEAAKVALREWKSAEEGGYSEGAWRVLGAVSGVDASEWAGRYSDNVFAESMATMRENVRWRQALREVREMVGWSLDLAESELGIAGLQAAETRMPVTSDLLSMRLAMIAHAYAVAGYLPQVRYCLFDKPRVGLSDFVRRRFALGGDVYAVSGLFGMPPTQWLRWESGVFFSRDEETIARLALEALADTNGAVVDLGLARSKHSALCARMTERRAADTHRTYDAAARSLVGRQERVIVGDESAAARRLRQRRNLRAAAHSWAILENGCAPCTSDPTGLKSVALFFMNGAEWPHYYKNHLRCR
jgi:hypothetical protein